MEEEAADADASHDGFLEELRQRRLQEMKKEAQTIRENIAKGHGELREIDEPDFLKEVTGSLWVCCHFYHRDFESCKVVDNHLKAIAKRRPIMKFVKIDAEKARFFVGKLQVRLLPTLIVFKDGKAVDRVVGLDELGETIEFPTARLEERLAQCGAYEFSVDAEDDPRKQKSIYSGLASRKHYDDDEGDDADLDS